MARVPAFARAFAGRWRIVEMDVWDNDAIDEVEEAHITFGPGAHGEIAFIAVSERPRCPLRFPRRIGLRRVLLAGLR